MTELPEPPERIAVFGLGGTIAMTATEVRGAEPRLSVAELLEAVPQLTSAGAELEVEDFRQLPGASLTFEDLHALTAAIRERLASGVRGIVVTQGTDTIEESAYFLDLLHDGPEPIVVTGALRNPSLAGADGPANLLAAVQVAASADARGRGCLVVMADQVHGARRVRKAHATSLTAFESPTGGPLGDVIEGRPRFLDPLPERLCLPHETARRRPAPRVGHVTVTLGDDGTLLDAAADRLDGLVVAGFGAGHVPEWFVERLAGLASRIPVVLASRTGSGTVLRSTYGFVGSESSLLAAGLVSAGWLDPLKARILLHLLLEGGHDHATISDAFAVAGGTGAGRAWPWPLLGGSHAG